MRIFAWGWGRWILWWRRLDGVPRAKGLTGGLLGDVNADGQVDLADALAVALYLIDPSITPPNNGDIHLGDVNADGPAYDRRRAADCGL